MNHLKVLRVTLEEALKVRKNATKTGFPESEVVDRRDSGVYIRHFVIKNESGKNLAACTFKLDQYAGKAAWQMYGVTIHSSFLKWLIHMAYEWPLIKEAMSILAKESGIRMFWTDIQTKIVPDYKSYGWEDSEEPCTKTGEKGPYSRVTKFVE